MAAIRSESAWTELGGAYMPTVCTMPATIVSGDMLVLLLTAVSTAAVSVSGWTLLYSYTHAATDYRQYVFYKTAAGGDTATATSTDATGLIHLSKCFAVTGVRNIQIGTSPLSGITVGYGDTDFNPPSLTTTGFVGELWIAAVFGWPGSMAGAPTIETISGYAGFSQGPTSAFGDQPIASAHLVKTTATENPGHFVLNDVDGTYSSFYLTLATIALGNPSNNLFGSNF